MLIDSFLFFNETELVELRIKYLEKIVDYFVVVEADITHQGKKKDWNFQNLLETKLNKYSKKISPLKCLASLIASLDLPEAVGPANNITFFSCSI